MGGDRTEGTASETASMDIHRVLDHIVSRYPLALVFWMGLSGIGQVEGGIKLGSRHRGIGWVDDDIAPIYTLQQTGGMHHVRLFLNIAEILGLLTFVLQALLMRMQHDIVLRDTTGDVFLLCKIDSLRDGFE